jgi:hypothetical protein
MFYKMGAVNKELLSRRRVLKLAAVAFDALPPPRLH